jgi:hypothetical protein
MRDWNELKRLAEAAEQVKPGRWAVHRDGLGPEYEPHPRQTFGVDDAQGCVVVWHGVGYNGIPHEEIAGYIAAANPQAILALIAENEGLRKDAERYRTLREMHWFDGPLAVVRNPKDQVKLGSFCPSRENLDAEVDAAMSKGGRQDG